MVKYDVPYQLDVRGVDVRTGQRIMNVLYFRNDAAAVPLAYGADIVGSSLSAFAASFRSNWRANILPLLSSHYKVLEYRVREISGWGGVSPLIRVTYGEQGISLGEAGLDTGGVVGEAVPDNVALSVQKITNKAGKSFRGGMRLSPIPEAQQSNGTLIAATHLIWQAALDQYYTTLISNGAVGPERNMLDYVFSRTLFFGSVPIPTQSETYTAFIVALRAHKNLGTQNTRKQLGDAPIDETA